jgi:hypothetical protein
VAKRSSVVFGGDILLSSHGKLRVVSWIHGGGGEWTAEELTSNGEERAAKELSSGAEELSSGEGEQVKQRGLHTGEEGCM